MGVGYVGVVCRVCGLRVQGVCSRQRQSPTQVQYKQDSCIPTMVWGVGVLGEGSMGVGCMV